MLAKPEQLLGLDSVQLHSRLKFGGAVQCML